MKNTHCILKEIFSEFWFLPYCPWLISLNTEIMRKRIFIAKSSILSRINMTWPEKIKKIQKRKSVRHN